MGTLAGGTQQPMHLRGSQTVRLAFADDADRLHVKRDIA